MDESSIRVTIFVAVLVCMIVLEAIFPKRQRIEPRSKRWLTNVGLILIDSIVLRIVLPVLAVSVAMTAEEQGWGLFNLILLPFWFELIFAIVLLDMAIYWQHVASHHWPVLWRLHKVHHSDRDIDVTTGIRFHPIEILLSMLYKLLCLLLIGPAVIAIVVFEILLNACALFNHANFKLPIKADQIIRLVLVTPDMHRVHHSVIEQETNSNYGFCLSIWDRVFGSYIAQPSRGHDNMTIGLAEYQTKQPSNLFWALIIPFKSKRTDQKAGGE